MSKYKSKHLATVSTEIKEFSVGLYIIKRGRSVCNRESATVRGNITGHQQQKDIQIYQNQYQCDKGENVRGIYPKRVKGGIQRPKHSFYPLTDLLLILKHIMQLC